MKTMKWIMVCTFCGTAALAQVAAPIDEKSDSATDLTQKRLEVISSSEAVELRRAADEKRSAYLESVNTGANVSEISQRINLVTRDLRDASIARHQMLKDNEKAAAAEKEQLRQAQRNFESVRTTKGAEPTEVATALDAVKSAETAEREAILEAPNVVKQDQTIEQLRTDLRSLYLQRREAIRANRANATDQKAEVESAEAAYRDLAQPSDNDVKPAEEVDAGAVRGK